MSNLVDHARIELELIGEEQETIEGYLKVIQAFADMGHSGGSASIAIPTINALLQWKNLSKLTNDPSEWFNHSDEKQKLWQSIRNPEAFSLNGGNTYYFVSDPKKKMHYSMPRDIEETPKEVDFVDSDSHV